MKLSYQWLREWVTPRLNARTLAERLTLAGIEVGAVEPVAPPLDRIIVARVQTVSQHPTIAKLTVCDVETGRGKKTRVVCGAPNVTVGMKVPMALPGATLAGERSIEKAEIQGVESAGMLCSVAELGLDVDSDGLLLLDESARIGASLADTLGLDDVTLELELTPNRGDCWSVAGMAREVAALTGVRLKSPSIRKAPVKTRRRVAVKIVAKKECPRYVGRVVQGIDPHARTPVWMRERLRRAGIRSLHPVVDITNYVMLELGQPMHAFDLNKLRGTVKVRTAGKEKSFTLLDGSEMTPPAGSLLITDDRGAIALAGVMGGADTAVEENTDAIFFESAFFQPECISRCVRTTGLKTESSQRFERGVDPDLQVRAVERATALLLQIAGGKPGPIVEAGKKPRARAPIVLRADRLIGVLGMPVDHRTAEGILKRLGMKVQRMRNGWRVVPPTYRFDVNIEVDLIEEVARVVGYGSVPVALPTVPAVAPILPENRLEKNRLQTLLIDRGYHEVVTYSFVDPVLQRLLDPDTAPQALANPISTDMAVMRTSLWPGLLQALRYNRNRQQHRVRIFEIGRRFLSHPAYGEDLMIGGAVSGTVAPEQWGQTKREVDFFDVKGDVEALLALTGRFEQFQFVPAVHPALHPGQSAAIHSKGKRVGWIGMLHPSFQAQLDCGKVVLFELLADVLTQRRVPHYAEVSRFPAIRRDLAVVVPETMAAKSVIETVKNVAGNLLANLQLFDVYRGEGIDSGRKSLALGLTFQDSSRTLREAEVDALEAQVIAALRQELGAELRG